MHGAFRGGWAWGEVPRLLRERGNDVLAPSLLGMGELAPPPTDRGIVRLDDWRRQLARLAELEELREVVAVGHSQGGLAVRSAADALGDRLAAIAYLDAPIARAGQRGVDLSGPKAPGQLPPRDMWIEAVPLGPDSGLDETQLAWVNERLGPTPVAPSLDPVEGPEPTVPTHVAFCTGTPEGFPSTVTRATMDAAQQPYELFDAPHDVAVAAPVAVATWLERIRPGR